MDNDEFVSEFLEEAVGYVNTLKNYFKKVCEIGADEKDLEAITMAIHNIKGTSSLFEFSKIAELSTEMEKLMIKIKNQQLSLNKERIEVLETCNECIYNMLQISKESEKMEISTLIELLDSVM
jgi:two-component system chemotaxis sensor kinase CheA